MIMPMKKISIIVQPKDADMAVGRLRRLGFLHVEHARPPRGKDINMLLEDTALIDNSIGVLSATKFAQVREQVEDKEARDWRFSAKHIVDLGARYDQLEEFSLSLLNTISEWEPWGDFDPDSIRGLSSKNIFVRLYQIPVRRLEELPPSVMVKKVSVSSGIANCVLISREHIELPFKEAALPRMSLGKMKARISQDSREMDLIKTEIRKNFCYKKCLLRAKKNLGKELEFHEALRGMGESESIMYLTGYAPADTEATFRDIAKQEQWGMLINEPADGDKVPTLIRAPRWVSIISPVFKMLEIVPGYQELDISFWFLIFFSVFFGMLIGDAGYGLVYLLLTAFAHQKFGKRLKDKSAFLLFYNLSGCAIIWGILTGTFFGQEWLINRGFKPLAPVLNDVKNAQTFCFFLGALHLTFAHSWRALLKLPSIAALSDIGWVFLLWAAFFFARLLILSLALPLYAVWLLITGIMLVVLFTSPQKNILKAMGAGLGALALSLMNCFTDVVSYVRLFAVGLAGVAIADTFNSMAAGIGRGNIIAVIAGGFIILTGHSLNLILGPMSVLVHGVRLNVLEFSGHANVTWSGFAYKPLKE